MALDSSYAGSGSINNSNFPKTPKSPARSRFSKALPAPPPVLEKLLPSRSASRPSTSVDETPSLPPLPPASSAVLSTSNFSYIPTTATPTAVAPSSPSVPVSNTSAPLPPPPPKSSARTVPGTISSARSPSLSLFPHQPPPPPAKKPAPLPITGPAAAQPQPQIPAPAVPSRAIRRRPVGSSVSVASSDSNRSVQPSTSPPPQEPTPAAAPVLSSLSTLPQLPDLPSFNSFSSLSELPAAPVARSSLPDLPELPSAPVDADASSNSETQSQTKTVRAPSPPAAAQDASQEEQEQEQEQEPSSSRVASISSILSAYSEDSSALAGLSSSNSEVTISTNTSSVMAAATSSPLRPLPSEKGQVFLDVRQPGSASKLDEDVHTPLSYLLDGDYADEEDDATPPAVEEKVVVTNGITQSSSTNTSSTNYPNNSDEYDPYSDAYYSYKPPQPTVPKKNDTSTGNVISSVQVNEPESPVAPAPISKTEAVRPPRSTSLRHPPPDVMSKTVTTGAAGSGLGSGSGSGLKANDTLPPLPSLPQHSSTPSTEIWRRRSEKAETNLSVTELNLKATPALQNAIAVAVAADAKDKPDIPDTLHQNQKQQQQQQQHQLQKELPPVAPAKDGGYLAYRQPLPPPQSPLPPPPRSALNNQLQPPRSPLVGGTNANGVSPSSVAPSPRLGLPGRDIRPSRQASPAVTPTTAPQLQADAAPSMGSSLTKLENKVESTFKRKPAPVPSISTASPAPPAKELPQPTTTTPTTTTRSPLTSKPQPPPPPPSFQGPPTPEYHDEEDKAKDNSHGRQLKDGASIVPSTMGIVGTSSSSTTVVNVPVSPATSPAASPAASTSSAFASAQQQQQSPALNSGLVGREIRPVKSAARLAGQNQPQQPQQQQFAPRTSSRNVSISTIPGALNGPVPPSKQVPATVPEQQHADSAVSFVSETGSQVTIKPVAQKQLPSQGPQGGLPASNKEQNTVASPRPDSSSTDIDSLPLARGMPPLFPSGYMTDVITPDTVFAAPPPSKIQFNCLQRHHDMFRDRNVNYPLSCQTCQTFERSMRWRCKWCYLRICSGCRDVLHTHAKHDLSQLLTYLTEGGHDAEGAAGEGVQDVDGKANMQSLPSGAELPVIQEA
ncbi:hypothetical protein Sste5346_002826 [Sporothrix stenoceras]|uniref:Uncharacterized protein n=1 Tax=Sporothrix stenoceras TaxID=5173 RepID=A0ABR3ZGY4_9PEZI